MAKKKKLPNKKKKSTKSSTISSSTSNNWVDRLDFEVLNEKNESDDESRNKSDDSDRQQRLDVRIVSWNVLAHAYLSRRSHRNLPPSYEDVVFQPKRRNSLINKVLKKLFSLELDIICLQEVDLPIVETTLREYNFEGASTPTIRGGGAGGRVDACCIYWNTNDWTLIEEDLIQFDDLATLPSKLTTNIGTSAATPAAATATAVDVIKLDSNFQGVQQSLLRRNVGIVVRLQHRTSESTRIVVANSHLYWNPEFDYVKLCQAHYAVERTRSFANGDPIVFCGDLNSQPGGPVHEYLTRGKVNAKTTAPWYSNNQRRDDDGVTSSIGDPAKATQMDQVLEQLDALDIVDADPQIKYILDFTLNRLTRWLRILGVDAALETDQEEIQRTKHSNFAIFDRCRAEGRALITTSSKLILRKDCPPGAYLISPKTLGALEAALVHLLLSHGVVLEPQNFLSRCVVCNGGIRDVTDRDEKKRIFAAHQAPETVLSDDLECYECDGCGQGYWWCDRPTSSASRVKGQATKLFEMCLRGGVGIKGPLSMFDFVDVEAERKKGLETGIEVETLQVLEWLKQEELLCPVELESSYALKDGNGTIVGECKPFTNVTSDFVGFLDYVLFESSRFELSGRLFLPGSFNELRNGGVTRNAHLLPSSSWPSDHLAVGAELSISIPAEAEYPITVANVEDVASEQKTDLTELGTDATLFVCGVLENEGGSPSAYPPPLTHVLPTAHQPRCGCGCVPNVLSLFEMAELRKQARLRAKQEQEVQP